MKQCIICKNPIDDSEIKCAKCKAGAKVNIYEFERQDYDPRKKIKHNKTQPAQNPLNTPAPNSLKLMIIAVSEIIIAFLAFFFLAGTNVLFFMGDWVITALLVILIIIMVRGLLKNKQILSTSLKAMTMVMFISMLMALLSDIPMFIIADNGTIFIVYSIFIIVASAISKNLRT